MKLNRLLEFIQNIDSFNDQAMDILTDDSISDRTKIVYVTSILTQITNEVNKVDSLEKIQ